MSVTMHRSLLGSLLLALCSVAAAASLRDGERLYNEGVLPDNTEVIASVMGGASLSGQFAACVRCHRPSGYGSSEGNLQIPAIAGSVLFSPLEPRRDRLFRQLYQERQDDLARMRAKIPQIRQAYASAADLGLAVNHGLDSEAEPLAASMPRYSLSPDALQSLTLYLQQLGASADPGVDQNELHLATVLGPGVPPDKAKAMLEVMEAFVTLHNREIERELTHPGFSPNYKVLYAPSRRFWHLHVWRLEGTAEEWPQQLNTYYQQQPVFAMLGGQVEGAWLPIDQFCESMKLPCLFPLTQRPASSDGHFTRYLSTGRSGEVEMAVRYLAEAGVQELSIVRDNQADSKQLADLFQALAPSTQLRLQTFDWAAAFEPVLSSSNDRSDGDSVCQLSGVANRLSAENQALVLLLSPAHARQALQCLEASRYAGTLLLIGSQLADGRGHPVLNTARPVLVTWQTAVPGHEPRRLYRLRRWLQARRVADINHEQLQLNTYLALDATRHALTHLLDRYSREYYLETIEHEIENGLNPGTFIRLSLGPEQRYAAKGGQVMQLQTDGALTAIGARSDGLQGHRRE
ncbi:hypothetical protein [Granulosicoccus antarcticus]|uniref:Cytochrome c domain-containing protein n=1 Tax=Granulosicoccus antarcticus IMCC3135 TaxID=1192854 RepID=A0A2Z2P0E2_9GAMM|nr:hypothetical protein [Granulosicoccus antarcticus]ASJ72904.1 hypothetical protein IMCC3135_14095 [Granulosicoccus antarcticus IMCC3135]